MNFTIREATEEDLPDILSIYSYYVENTNYSFEYITPSAEVFLARYRNTTSQFPWLVAVKGKRIVGYAYGSKAFERAAYSWDADVTVYLDPEAHGRGFAAALYRALIPALAAQGYYKLYALIPDVNHKSLAFHRKVGFRETGHLRDSGFKNGKWVGVIWTEMTMRSAEGIPSPVRSFSSLPKEDVELWLRNAVSEDVISESFGNIISSSEKVGG